MKKIKIFLLVLVVLFGGFNSAFAQTVPAPIVTVWLQKCNVNGGCPGGSGGGFSTLSVSPDDNPEYVGIFWHATNATTCTRSGDWSGVVPIYPNADGTLDSAGEPYAGAFTTLGTHTYGLSCTGAGGTATSSATLSVVAPDPSFPSAKLTASKYAIKDGESITLSWTSSNAVSCSATDRWQIAGGPPYNSGGSSGSQVVGPLYSSDSPFKFGIGCYGSDGQGNTLTSPRSIIVVTATDPATTITPTISRITSDTTPSVGDTVTISGSNFNTSTEVVLTDASGKAMVPAKTTIKPIIISPTSLSFVPLKDVNSYEFTPGPYSLQVQNGTLLSNSISFNIVSLSENTKLNLLYPAGYVTWKIGSTQTIQWKTERIPSTATGKIVLGTDSGKNWTVVDNILNTGSYTWKSVGTAADGSLMPASNLPYSINVYMNAPTGLVTNFPLGFRLVTLSNTTGDVSPNPTPTPLPVECLSGPGAVNNCPGTTGQFCGGIAGFQCAIGYSCKLDGSYPDAGGTCVKNIFTTPSSGCSGDNRYNTQTGESCFKISNPPVLGCSGGNIYNTQTGLPCVNNVGNDNQPSGGPSFYDLGTITLRNGSRGDAVKELQRYLNDDLGLGLIIDGKLGPKTIAVIIQWQSDNGLTADGLIGPKTKAEMMRKLPRG